ncbi:MAG: sugar ABC transporter permease [Ruminococcus sp.]|nr:sugar ABC transporter permease [Ruminococcus sp.]
MEKMLRNKKALLVFMLPAFLLFTLVLFIPIIQSVYYSLCDYKGMTDPVYIGLDNYKNLLHDKTFGIALKNSMFFLVFSCVSQLILGLIYAAILTNIKKGRNLFKNIIYLPCVLSSAALGLLWLFIFGPKLGINQLLMKWGVENPPLWLMSTKGTIPLPMWMIAFVSLWQFVGQSMMLYMAQISGISKSLMEASYIDGCTKPMAFRYITLPLIKPMVATAMSLNAIGSLKFFDLIWNMTTGGPNHKTEVLATHLYQQFKFFKYGYASAIGVVLLILCLLVTLFINKVVKTEQYEM